MAVAITLLSLSALASSEAPDSTAVAAPRQLVSVGCDNCCFQNDCSLAFSQTQPGVCCGAHPYSSRRQTGCCPMGASCVACGHIWKCTMSSYVTATSKCSICRDDQVRECLYRRTSYGHHSSGSSFASMLLMLLVLFALAGCFFYGRPEPDVVVVQGGMPGQVMQGGYGGMPGQTVVVQGGGCTRPSVSPCHYPRHDGARPPAPPQPKPTR